MTGGLVVMDGNGAVFNEDRRYRYALWRDLVPLVQPKRTVLFVMLNPSSADELTNDPTLRRCEGFARNLGFHRLMVGNLFAFRSTQPQVLRAADDPFGSDGPFWWDLLAKSAETVVCAWGVDGRHARADERFLETIHPRQVFRLGPPNKDGSPKHPLYLPADTRLEPWTDAYVSQPEPL